MWGVHSLRHQKGLFIHFPCFAPAYLASILSAYGNVLILFQENLLHQIFFQEEKYICQREAVTRSRVDRRA